MRIPIEMPRLGYDMEQGRISSWLKQVGDPVTRGEVIAEIETEKATVDMEALDDGVLAEIVHDAGSEVSVGEPIGYLEQSAKEAG